MAGIFGISKKGRYLENYQEAFYISGNVTQADVGKAVTLDTTAEKTVKLCGVGDEVYGRLEVLEQRNQEGINVCTVSLKVLDWFPTDGTTIAVGAGVQGGANPGTVKTQTATRHMKVVHVDATNNRVFVILL